MRLSDLDALLCGRLSGEAFLSLSASDMQERRTALAVHERGRIIPVRVLEDADVRVTRREVSRLLTLFLDRELGAVEVAYIADALQLSERVDFADELVADSIAACTDPEINGELTAALAEELISDLEQAPNTSLERSRDR